MLRHIISIGLISIKQKCDEKENEIFGFIGKTKQIHEDILSLPH